MPIKSILNVFIILLIIYLVIVVLTYILQEKLLFHPVSLPKEPFSEKEKELKNIESINIKSNDSTKLHGWLAKEDNSNNKQEKSPLVLYFGGNAEEVSHMVEVKDKFPGYSLAPFNYRGYGLSEGTPTEEKLFSDALTIYDYMASREDIDENNIVLMGRSLGSGVVVHLASKREVKGLILVTPYDSITNVAKNKLPFLPVSYLLKHNFDSVNKAPNIKTPMLALIAENDNLVPPEHGKKLAKEWGGEYELKVIKDKDHNTIDMSEDFWKSINSFISELNKLKK
ncbi:alpha/beta hydrolase [Natranaerofaba carboxydovora]|uniref:alpha/beta hydrolase n=1 Tax=Natranaerofaba carboxydovora TaxID=2742683 RepID=UPI001F129CBC|nr:alpha/beta hydrolase [Natranaerofaba carboxydovora]UMZ73667.1 Multifunctional-autoprocessing repeats-in-toxin [Natranaerofaba carboxydovora]